MRIGVLEVSQNLQAKPNRFIPLPEAKALVRKLFAEWVSKTVIRLLKIRSWAEIQASKLPHSLVTPKGTKHYQHHIEPRIMSLKDSDFNRYLRGY